MILVTGANGQLGQCLEDQNRSYHRDILFATRNELDITNERMMRLFCVEHRVKLIINCAAYTKVDQAESEQECASLVNAQAPEVLARLCSELGMALIHISTDYVFDGTKQAPYLESDQCAALNTYGRSKLAGEQNILKHSLNGAIIRTSWLYSEYAPNFLMTMKKLAQTKKELQVVADQKGSPTYAATLAGYILEHLDILSKCKMDIYHFSNSGETTWYEFARAILADTAVLIHPINSDEWKSAAPRSRYSVLNCEKITKLTDGPMISWQEGLKQCLAKLS